MHLYPNVQRDLCTVRPILMDVQSPIPCSLHGQACSHGRTEPDPLFSARSGLFSWTYRARSPVLCTVRPILMDAQSPIPCSLHGQANSLATLRKRSFYYIGYQKEKSRTPPFKSSERLEMGTFSIRFAMGLGRGLTSRISARRGLTNL